jgi:hypothetical protein
MKMSSRRSHLGFVLFVCSCALLFAYVVWFVFFKPALRIEGKERISIADFGNGATVTHAFVMPVDGLHGVSVKISVDRPSTLTFSYKLLQLSNTSPGGENRLDAYAEIHGWSDRLTVASGERWHRVTFPSVAASKDGWYAFEIRLLDASPARGPTTADAWPAVSIAASQDNPAGGGKFWIDGVRQPGSPFLLAYVRSDGMQIALLLAYLLTLAALIYVTFFAGGRAHDALLRLLRSVLLPQAVTVIALVVGLPLFLRSPLWADLTLYDVAARNLLWGGVHYRDVFDTNLPGFVWIMALIRGALGFDLLALRLVDLAIVTGIVLLIDRIAKLGGASPVARWWAIAGAAVLYPSTVEIAHAQRDTWMALPAAAAVLLRLRRLNRRGVTRGRIFLDSALEGALWGVAVWIKPHCLLMAAGVWLFSVWRVANTGERRLTGFAADLLGNVASGLALAVLGIGGIALSGGWPYFWDILTVWAPEYTRLARREFAGRFYQELHWFPPWSLWLIPTVPLAMLSILDAPFWSSAHDGEPGPGPMGRVLPRWLWVHAADPEARFARGGLAVLYLVWAAQSFVVQRGRMYVHLAELFLMFGLWAAHRWSMPAVVITSLALTSTAWLVGDAVPQVRTSLYQIAVHDSRPASEPDKEHYFVRHPLADLERLRIWPDCWRGNMTEQERFVLWGRLQRLSEHVAAFSWDELGEVADYLQSRGVQDGELIAWDDTPHALYLMLGIKPGLRFMHIHTAQSISMRGYAQVQSELASKAGVARFAVGDLARTRIIGPPLSSRELLPQTLPAGERSRFPFNQETVFRSRSGQGRYTVHELAPPLGDHPRPSEMP